MTTLIEIQNQIASLQKQAEEIRTNELAQNVQDILSKMDAFGITVDDLERARGRTRKSTPTTKTASPAPVKFRGPNGEAWTGRGLMPRWLAALVAQGQAKESFAV
jgi:DNA-binding protein H-NS